MIIRPQRDPVETYLHEVANRLRGPRRLREDMLCELRSGVLDAVEIRCRAGMARPDAARSATAEFGAARVVASTFNAELVLAQARRSTRAMLVTGPMVAALWIVAAITNHLGLTFPPPLTGLSPVARWTVSFAPPLGLPFTAPVLRSRCSLSRPFTPC